MRRLSVLFVILSVLTVLVAPAALAAPPRGVQITVDVDIATTSGDFIATGPAVSSGLMCASGEAVGTMIGDITEGTWLTRFTVDYVFTCDDLSGTAKLRLNVWLNPNTGRTFAFWRALGGQGAYVGLSGFGWLIGTPVNLGVTIEDAYTGWLRI